MTAVSDDVVQHTNRDYSRGPVSVRFRYRDVNGRQLIESIEVAKFGDQRDDTAGHLVATGADAGALMDVFWTEAVSAPAGAFMGDLSMIFDPEPKPPEGEEGDAPQGDGAEQEGVDETQSE